MGKRKDSNKPRGRMSAYAYFVQTARSSLHPNEQVVFTQFSKECADKWRHMGEHEKKVYNEKSAQDKIRYDREMAHYQPPKGEKKKGKGRRRKDPDAPKRNLSAFFLFSRDERGAIKREHPDWSVGKIAQQLAAMWKTVTPAEKERYDHLAAQEKDKYLRAMEIYKANKPKQSKKQQKQRKESSSSSSSDDSSSDDSSSDSDSDEE